MFLEIVCVILKCTVHEGDKIMRSQYTCSACKYIMGPFLFTRSNIACPRCRCVVHAEPIPESVSYTEFAELTVQNDSQAGKSSRCSAKIVLLGEFDNVESLVGQKVRITGCYIAYNITVYGCTSVDVGTTFLANHLEPYNAVDRPLVCDVLQNIRQLNNARIFDRIVASIAPTIKGFDRVRRALVLSLFSGVPKTVGKTYFSYNIYVTY